MFFMREAEKSARFIKQVPNKQASDMRPHKGRSEVSKPAGRKFNGYFLTKSHAFQPQTSLAADGKANACDIGPDNQLLITKKGIQ